MKKVLSIISICTMLIAFVSCQKGDPGPPGNANVITQRITILPGQWSHYGISGQPDEGFAVTVSSSIITPDIVNTGVVIAYFSNDGSSWTAMPYTFPTGTNSTTRYSESWNFYYSINLITFNIQDSDFFTAPPLGNCFFKIAAISASFARLHPNVDWNNYKELEAVLCGN